MHIDWAQVIGWLTAAASALAAAWGWARANKQHIMALAAEAVAFSEKYYSGCPNQELEDEAVGYFKREWPSVPENVVRAAIRLVCRNRRERAQQAPPTPPQHQL